MFLTHHFDETLKGKVQDRATKLGLIYVKRGIKTPSIKLARIQVPERFPLPPPPQESDK